MAKISKTAKPATFPVVKTKIATPVQLAAVMASAFAYGRTRADAYSAIVKAGGDTDAVRRAFMEGYVASILSRGDMTDAAVANAARVLDCVGVGAKTVPVGSGRRTEAEEKAYGAARTAWKVVRAVAGAKKNVNKARGAYKVAETVEPKVAPIVTAPVATTPHVTKPADAIAHLQLQAASLLAFANKNAKSVPIACRNAVAAFCAAMKEIEATEELPQIVPAKAA